MTTKPRPPLQPGETRAYPVLPLRDIVVFPHMIVPLFVGREKSIKALEEVMKSDTFILLATQKNASDDDPATGAIFQIGTLASVLQLLKLPDGTVKVLVEGATRARVRKYSDRNDYYEAEATVIADDVGDKPGAFTRFVALAPYTQIEAPVAWRTAISFVTDHRPGALYHALGAFARNGVNLVQLVSRPLPNSPWRYRFDAVLDGSVFDDVVRPALQELRQETRELRLFGSYAAERTQ